MLNRKFLLTFFMLISIFQSISTADARQVPECGVIYRQDWWKIYAQGVIGCGGASCVGSNSCQPLVIDGWGQKWIREIIWPGNPLYNSYNGMDTGPNLCLLVGGWELQRRI